MAVAHEASSAVRLEPAASAAAERLFQQHSGWIYGYCFRLLRSREEAEDAVQATYLNACRSLKDGFQPRADSAWLLKVAQNVCLTRLRSSGRRSRIELAQDAEVLEETVAAPDRTADDLIGLPEALAALPPQQRQAILLREWQGLSYKEVAQELGITQGAVETLIFRARRSLATALENTGSERRRALHGLDLGGLAMALKSLLGGGAAVKLAALAAVATTATVVAADPVGWHRPAAADQAPVSQTTPPVPAQAPAAAAGTQTSQAPVDRAERRFFAADPAGRAVRAGGPGHGRALGKSAAKGKLNAGHGKALGRGHAKPNKAAPNVPGLPGQPSEVSPPGPPAQASAQGKSAKSA